MLAEAAGSGLTNNDCKEAAKRVVKLKIYAKKNTKAEKARLARERVGRTAQQLPHIVKGMFILFDTNIPNFKFS